MNLRVVTYNIHRTVGHDGLEKPERIMRVLREVDADIMALQEVACRTGAAPAVPRFLGESLQALVIEGITLHAADSTYGNAVLSRLPVAAVRRHTLSVPGRHRTGAHPQWPCGPDYRDASRAAAG